MLKDQFDAIIEEAKKVKTLQKLNVIFFELLEKQATINEIEMVLNEINLSQDVLKEVEEDSYGRKS